MGKIGDLWLAIHGDLTGFDRDLNKAAKKGESIGARLKAALSPKNLFAGFGAGVGISAFQGIQAAIGGAIGAIGDWTKAARDETVAVAALTTSLQANDKAWDGNVAAIEEVIDARMELGFGDDEQRVSLAKLVAITRDHSKALDLQRVAMDLARLRGIDLATAGELLGKVYAGNVGILKRYGISVRAGATAAEAIAAIQAQTAGQAEAWAETEAGAAATTQIALEELGEDIGAKLLPAMTELTKFVRDDVIPTLEFLLEHIEEIGDGVAQLLGPIGNLLDLAGDIGDPLRDFGEAIAESGRSASEAQTMIDSFAAATGQSKNDIGDSLMALVADGRTFEQAWAEIGGNVVVSWGDDTRETARLAGQGREAVGSALEGTADVIAGPFEAGGARAVRSISDMYADIASEIAMREAALESAGGDAVDAWFEPMEAALKGRELQRGIEELNDEIADLQANGTNAQVEEAQGRRLALVKEQILLQIALANIGTQVEQDAKLHSIMASDWFQKGLVDGDPEIAAAFQHWQEIADEHFAGVEANAVDSGEAVPVGMAGSMTAAAPVVKPAAEAVAGYVTGALDLADDARGWGSSTANAFAAGLASGQAAVIDSANLLGYAAGRILGVQSEPDDPRSPLRGITQWGGNIVRTITGGILGELGLAGSASAALAAALVPALNPGGLGGLGGLPAGAAGEGTTIQYILNVEGRPKTIGTRDDVLDAWEQEERF